jgi:photosystem II stability/assembly factor-like uncharacterized protein
MFTTDGGNTWKERESPCPAEGLQECKIADFLFTDRENGFFVGEGPLGRGKVLHTRDGGMSFEAISIFGESGSSPHTMLVHSNGDLWIVARKGIAYSENNGADWKLLQTSPGVDINSAVVGHDKSFFLTGGTTGFGVLYRTKRGESFEEVFRSDAAYAFWRVDFADERVGCLVGSPNILYCTADGGRSWQRKTSLPAPLGDQSNTFINVRVFSTKRIWILRAGGFLYESLDSGDTWKQLPRP